MVWVLVHIPALSQTLVDFNTIPKSGTVLVYSHQDDDVIWMLPFWGITEKFIDGAMPSTSIFRNVIHDQQTFLNNNGYANLQYEQNWTSPWTSISPEEYYYYYGYNDPAYEYIKNDHLESKLWDDTTPLSRTEINKIKAKIEQYIASPSVSRIITHNNWGEYGHQHHKGVNLAVRELAVKYGKDVWMLGCDNGSFGNVDLPAGITYTMATWDTELFKGIRTVYQSYHEWTWSSTFVPTGQNNYIKIVDGGIDKSDIMTGETVKVTGPPQYLPGSYIFNGTEDYLTLLGNNYNAFTISMRIRPDQIGAMDISKMSEYPSAATCDHSFYMEPGGQVTARIFDGQSRTITSTTALPPESWTHILMTSDGSNLKIFINGILEGTTPAGQASSYISPEFVLGQAQETSSFFKGQITDVRLFDHVLSDAEITSLASGSIKAVTITGITANNKIYDGTKSATLNLSSAVLSGVSGGDNVSLVTSGATGTFVDKNAGAGKLVAASGFTLTGTDAVKYILVQPILMATIDTKYLTLEGSFIADSKLYDGTVDAVVSTNNLTLKGIIGADDVSFIPHAVFTDANIGTLKTITITDSPLNGSDASNYSLYLNGAPESTASISQKPIVITANSGQSKIYKSTDPASFSYTFSPALIGGDVISGELNRAPGETVGSYPFTSGTLTAGSNYSLSVATTPTYEIVPKTILITSNSGQSKVYNQADPVFTFTNSPSLEAGDNFTGAIGRLSGDNVGTYAFTLSTLSAGPNYNLAIAPTPTFNITPKVLGITGISALDKIYDRSTNCILAGTADLNGIEGGDIVTVSGTPSATFNSVNAGNNVGVSVTGFLISGVQAGNYSLSQPLLLTANITPKTLTIAGSFIAANKIYDGLTTAVILTNNLTIVGIESSDYVTLSAVAAFSDISTGNGKNVSLTGSFLAGSAAQNYTLSLAGAPTTTANIVESGLTVNGITANNKVYDGTTFAVLNSANATLAGNIGTDIVELVSSGATGRFVDKNVGHGKVVVTNGFTLSGPDANKYTLIQPTVEADISSTTISTFGITANDKTYDGTSSAVLNLINATLNGVVNGDEVYLDQAGSSASFDNKNTGTLKQVTVTELHINGTDAQNYSLADPSLTANITPASLTITGVTANNKQYDGTTTTTLNTAGANLSGVIGADIVSLVSTGATGVFHDKNVSANKSISTSGFIIEGAGAVNYSLTQPSLSANISAKPLTIKVNDQSKTYGSDLNFSGTEISTVGLVSGDIVQGIELTSPGALSSAVVGSYPISITGGSDNNYTFIYIGGILTVIKAQLLVTADHQTKTYGSPNPPLTISYSGFKNGKSSSVLASQTVASTNANNTSNVGTYTITLSGGSDPNYDLLLVNGTMDILKAPLTISADDKSKVYQQSNPSFTLTYSGFVPGQDQGVLDALPVISTSATTDSDAGIYDINVSGAIDLNYDIIYHKGTMTIKRADQQITFPEIPAGLKTSQSYQLSATASSNLPVSFKVSDQTIGSLNSNNVLKIFKNGNLTITAQQDGNKNWNPAPAVIHSVSIESPVEGIPSLFTPNNDGINDYWVIPDLIQYGNIQVTVYNRYGQAVFNASSYNNNWDGTWNGSPLPSATYYYIIKSSTQGYIRGVLNIIR